MREIRERLGEVGDQVLIVEDLRKPEIDRSDQIATYVGEKPYAVMVNLGGEVQMYKAKPSFIHFDEGVSVEMDDDTIADVDIYAQAKGERTFTNKRGNSVRVPCWDDRWGKFRNMPDGTYWYILYNPMFVFNDGHFIWGAESYFQFLDDVK